MDVTDPAYPALLGRLVQETGPFDACIYCVGVGAELELSDLSQEARVFEVNLTAMVVGSSNPNVFSPNSFGVARLGLGSARRCRGYGRAFETHAV